MHLIQYLSGLVDLEDVREQNKKAFQLSDLGEDEIREYLQVYTSPDDEVEEEDEEDEQSEEYEEQKDFSAIIEEEEESETPDKIN